MTENKKETCWNLPTFISDPGTKTEFKRSTFLGKGAFGKCFELINTESGDVYAGKIVSKEILRKTQTKEKMIQEISIHKHLDHKHVVSFHRFFEDESYIYIILELCRRRSMSELHKRRQCLTDPEVRYYMKQILSAVLYLHDNNIVHRDLKLGNIFINDSMEVKIGDFGLSTYIENGERKKTMCGTPNYIAPEILEKTGHGFEVDIWSVGCIIFTLLIGKPPFETSSVKETYGRILRCDYCVPVTINKYAEKMIRRIFVKNPLYRPKAKELIHDQFFSKGYTPPCLPTSCLVMAPKFSIADKSLSKKRKPLSELNVCDGVVSPERSKNTISLIDGASEKISGEKHPLPLGNKYLKVLQDQLTEVLNSKPSEREVINIEDIEDPAAHPFMWISSWVDYSDKYGFAYKLNDSSIGVVFIDRTKIVLLSNGINVQYMNKDGSEKYFTIHEFDPALKKKMRLLELFQEYMGHLMKTGSRIPVKPSESDNFIRVPVLGDWIRYDRAIVMLLSNGTLQVNFFPDHSKIILCPLMGAITFIDKNEVFHTYRLKLIKHFGCNKMLAWRIQYTLRKISHMICESSNK